MKKGFTLIEVICAVAILSIIMVMFSSLFTNSLTLSSNAQKIDNSSAYSKSLIEKNNGKVVVNTNKSYEFEFSEKSKVSGSGHVLKSEGDVNYSVLVAEKSEFNSSGWLPSWDTVDTGDSGSENSGSGDSGSGDSGTGDSGTGAIVELSDKEKAACNARKLEHTKNTLYNYNEDIVYFKVETVSLGHGNSGQNTKILYLKTFNFAKDEFYESIPFDYLTKKGDLSTDYRNFYNNIKDHQVKCG